MLKSTGTTANNYRYCGEQFDSTTGLYYLRARYMDTSTGRFISQDSYAGSTADPVSLHKYLYANSNPVMYSDPSGYTSLGEMVCVSAVMGGIAGATINVAGYLDSLLSWRDFDFNTMLQSAFEGFLCGMTMGALFGVSLVGVTCFSMIFPSLAGLETAYGYAFGVWGTYQSISSGITQYNNGNYASAVTLGFWGWLGGFALMQSIFTNYFSNDITSIAEQNKTLVEEQPKKNVTDNLTNRNNSNAQLKDIINNSKSGNTTKGSTTQYIRSGGYDQAVADFESLNPTNVKDINISSGGMGKVGVLSDGSTAILRPSSTYGSPTLEIQSKTSNSKIKIRYE